METDETSEPLNAVVGSIASAEIGTTELPSFRLQSRSHRFIDPRQQRIYDRLSAIGPGPAGFFRDACFIVDRPDLLVMSAHFVGHALREEESAIRGVLCATFNIRRAAGADGHRQEIEAIVGALGLPLDDAAARAWLSIPGAESGLQAWAHRRNLGRRVLDSEFSALWDQVQLFLDVVLGVFETESVRAFDVADRLIAIDPPSDSSVRSAMEDLVKAPVVMEHFAKTVPLSWFAPLLAKGFFDGAPSVDELAEGTSWEALRWPNVELLRRAASVDLTRSDSWAVVERLSLISNPALQVDLVDIALESSAADAARLVRFVRKWLGGGGSFLLVDRLTRLLAHLVDGGEVDAAFELSGALLVIGDESLTQDNRDG